MVEGRMGSGMHAERAKFVAVRVAVRVAEQVEAVAAVRVAEKTQGAVVTLAARAREVEEERAGWKEAVARTVARMTAVAMAVV